MRVEFLKVAENQKLLLSIIRNLKMNLKNKSIHLRRGEFNAILKYKEEITTFLDFPLNWEIILTEDYCKLTKIHCYKLTIKTY